MSLEEFKAYVTNSGVNFDGLSDDKKGEWRERFDRSRQPQQPAGKFTFQNTFDISNHIICNLHIICYFSAEFILWKPYFCDDFVF